MVFFAAQRSLNATKGPTQPHVARLSHATSESRLQDQSATCLQSWLIVWPHQVRNKQWVGSPDCIGKTGKFGCRGHTNENLQTPTLELSRRVSFTSPPARGLARPMVHVTLGSRGGRETVQEESHHRRWASEGKTIVAPASHQGGFFGNVRLGMSHGMAFGNQHRGQANAPRFPVMEPGSVGTTAAGGGSAAPLASIAGQLIAPDPPDSMQRSSLLKNEDASAT